jgi:hypothetical protein
MPGDQHERDVCRRMDAKAAGARAGEPRTIVGIAVAHYRAGLDASRARRQAGTIANIQVIDFGEIRKERPFQDLH